MKFYSEILDKVFDTPEQLKVEEDKYAIKQKAQEKKRIAQEQATKANEALEQSKKQYAKAIEDADEKVKEAYNNLSLAQEKAKILSEEYIKELNNIMTPAREAVREAEATKLEAIRQFNQKFGVYKVSYTGNKAVEEYIRAINMFDNTFNIIDKFF